MAAQLLKMVFSFMALMVSGPLLFSLAFLIWQPRIEAFFSENPAGIALAISLYLFFVSFMFFRLQDYFIIFRPKEGCQPLSRQDLLTRLEQAFRAPVEGMTLFDFQRSDDKAVITWSSSITFFQGTSGGVSGMKRVIALHFDEQAHTVFFIMKDKDWQWNLSENFAGYSLNYSAGISAEFRCEVHPSIEFGKDGLRVEMKKLTYSSDELWLPIQEIVLASGWTLRGGMLPYVNQRIILCSAIAAAVFLLIYGAVTALNKAAPSKPKKSEPLPAAAWQPPAARQISAEFEKIAASMATPQLRNDLEMRLQKMPVQYLVKGNDAVVFAAYARAYLARRDKDDNFAATLRKFAGEHRLDFGR